MKRIKYRAVCLEPVHIGTGEYQLGRVDNTIVREPATGIPKIPGTTLAGVFRAHFDEKGKTFFGGKISEKMEVSKLMFSDARVLFFPVRSNIGTVWISTRERLKEAGIITDSENTITDANSNAVTPVKSINGIENIALGWLYLPVSEKIVPLISADFGSLPQDAPVCCISNKLFYHIVNDNLEVRTSVRIGEDTGTAKTGGLFTSEALPRGTVLSLSISIDTESDEASIINNLSNAIGRIELLGLGGMKTRGFGRLRITELGGQE
jgi:CRISPR-associated protein Cmr4